MAAFENDRDRAQSWLKTSKRRKAFKKLEKEIVATGICTECGACVEICPVDALAMVWNDSEFVPDLVGECIACGLCYAFCPRTFQFPKQLLGTYIEAWQAKSAIHEHGQNGGVASTILRHALSTGGVEVVVCGTARSDSPWKPEVKSTRDISEIQKYAGTIYSHVPVVGRVLEELKAGRTKVAVVGTSCHIDSLAKMEDFMVDIVGDAGIEILKLGLFCMESFSYAGLKLFLEERGIEIRDIIKMEISGGKFRVLGEGIQTDWPVGDLDSVAASSCQYCTDLTCKNADISFGNIGSEDSLTTVLVRTQKGKDFFDSALKEDMIKGKPLDEKQLLSIERIAKLKATRCYTQ
jgi:coenzyme F420 hydrogenase subunit beta